MNLTFESIKAAAERLDGHIEKTPMRRSRTLSEITGADVWVKFENQQFTAAYKERGALNKLLQLTADERRRGVIAASAGNHAQAHPRRVDVEARRHLRQGGDDDRPVQVLHEEGAGHDQGRQHRTAAHP